MKFELTGQLELVLDAKATLAEGPTWDPHSQCLYWVDIIEKKIHQFDPKTAKQRSIQADQYVGSIVSHQPGVVILAMEKGIYSLDLETERFKTISIPAGHLPNHRFNDGKCDAAGRYWAGTIHIIDDYSPTGKLFCLHPDFSISEVLDHIYCSNGIAWNAENTIMYYIDSPTKKVFAFDFDLKSGEIFNRRTAVVIPEGGGVPDGMTIDEEGMLWVAQWDGYQVSRWNPKTGEKLETIPVPAARVTSCTFGGKDLDELYITTARTGLTREDLFTQPYAGGLFRIRTNVKGLPAHSFG